MRTCLPNSTYNETSSSSLRKNVRCLFCKLEYPTILGSVQHADFIGVFIDYANDLVGLFSKAYCLLSSKPTSNLIFE